MSKFTLALALTGAYTLMASAAFAADGVKPAKKDLQINVGAGAMASPAFLGSKDYQLSTVPFISVTYKDQFFASIPTGIGYNAIRSSGWRAGPIARFAFAREEANGANPFQVAGAETNALQGLGDVDSTLELGAFAEYTWKEWSAKVEARQGVGGHEGFITDLSANYQKVIPAAFSAQGSPLIVSVGPRATLVDSNYNQAYFGVNATQSANSGLSHYNAGAGLLSYGLGATAIYPISDKVTATSFAAYDRVAGDAGDSPLVQQRGSENQATVGVFLTYAFGY